MLHSAHLTETLHSIHLTETVALAFGFALVLGFLAVRIRLPALVGYLLAGILISPFTPGFVASIDIAAELAEIGVILLMFGVGLHLSLGDLWAVRKIALPGAMLQIAASAGLGTSIALAWGWPLGSAVIFGLSLSVASTVVLLRALETRGILGAINGRIAIGWLVVEDIVTVVVLVLLPAMAGWFDGSVFNGGDVNLAQKLATALIQMAKFVVLMLVVGRRLFPWLLRRVADTGSRELFTLCIVAAAIGITYGAAALFGVSFTLGAFLAGMVLRESELSHRAATESLPLRDAFAVLFFVSVGMLFNPAILIEQPWKALAVVAMILVGNPLIAATLVFVFRYPLNTVLTVAAGLAQIGEFSFIIAGMGMDMGLLSTEAHSLIIIGALISIAVNPLVFRAIRPMQSWIRARSSLARMLERSGDPLAELPVSTSPKYLSKQVVLVGYGRVGRWIGETLTRKNIPYVVVEQNRERVEELRRSGVPAVSGDASEPAVLVQAHIARARMLVVAAPDTFNVQKMIKTARSLNQKIDVAVRTRSEEEAELLSQESAGKVFLDENELATGMTRYVLARAGRVWPR